jgi:hypothetical protein
MEQSVARVPTEVPDRYVKQIVSHLARKRVTRLAEDGTGIVTFDAGACTLRAEPGVLVLVASGTDEQTLGQVRDVLGRHLERFGAREGLRVTWSTPA